MKTNNHIIEIYLGCHFCREDHVEPPPRRAIKEPGNKGHSVQTEKHSPQVIKGSWIEYVRYLRLDLAIEYGGCRGVALGEKKRVEPIQVLFWQCL
jgi:hypothetical protein